ncbi:Na+ dependent nucleoside transporter domain protein [Gluconacetobacter diazotrophicus PA1 5]|uniref:NupC/NupG family nucleoside CNT transporter n=2 Tax=Gluconacetobacter diazotrophicus TaxID=33996 RepID=A0A7W4I4J4_GLUDI|nr:NupC/NupG family nucleoside CNT transporter [Gluconacetobacter diazotrophicus]ACI50093.1 Na+ dependent nucleoside transporter domain protein [Gluconacetobacter diazotrophicus PA1 5]MBB2156213.1 NupC/NupG family nucleoside CNT transporter [Gluconacetobacter diazotrophicus]TWB07827.1 CNT family concentrative nucleoside transporter [Gluconacetobacter diazotrophicus]CAP56018.1 putative inner membrane transport protein [Gluconacetobacter diazotrophicus PA1 5]
MPVLHGILGLAGLIGLAVAFSTDRRAIRPRIVLAAGLMQVALGGMVLFVPPGRHALHALSGAVDTVLGYGAQGSLFLFGALVDPRMNTLFPHTGFIFAFRVLPQIVYVSALIAILYHYRVMQRLAALLGGAVRRALGTSTIESFSAVTTIFLGQSEMPVALRPYVPLLTRAELFAVMSSGTASVAGSVLAGYAGLGVPMDYLLAASVMAIPGGLLFAKILMPAREATRITRLDLEFGHEHPATVFEAVAIGAASGVGVAVAVGSMLIAFIGLIALANGMIHGLGGWLGIADLSLERLFGVVFAPLAWLIGVPWHECGVVGAIMGQKLVFNEFVAYVALAPHFHDAALDPRALAIASFALCGFANLSSIGILIAGFGSVAPERRADVAKMGLRAVMAGSLSNFASATIAGMFVG